MQTNAAQHLHIKMPHAKHAAGGLTHNRKRLRQNIIQCFAVFQPFLELRRMTGQRGIADIPQARFQRIDLVYNQLHALYLFIIIVPQEPFEKTQQT